MSEIVGSAIVGEAVSRVFSGMISRYEDNADGRGNTERLEMAHIKMEAAIEISSKWQTTDVSMLRWQEKLKRASQECNHTVRKCKRLSREEKRFKEQIKRSSFPRRVAHATKSFMSSFVGNKKDECSSKAIVRRFERLADGADNFLRYVQLGGTPRRYMFFDPLITHLFAGKSAIYEMWYHGRQYHYFGVRPMSFEGRGLEAMLAFVHADHEVPENNFHLGCTLRLSESTDIIGIIIKCLQMVTPRFKSIAEFVIKELTQLPTQDFSWLAPYAYGNMEHWNNIHDTLTRCLRPDPLCCQGYEMLNVTADCSSRSTNASRLSLMFPEPVCQVFLQCYIPLPEHNSLQGSNTRRTLKLGVLFVPHDSVDDLKSTSGVENSAIEAIDGEKQRCTHVDVHPHQLDEMLLPKAIDYLCRNIRATTYRISWNSRHGSLHLCVEKISMQNIIARRAMRQSENKSKLLELQGQLKQGQWKQVVREFLEVWGLCNRLQGSSQIAQAVER